MKSKAVVVALLISLLVSFVSPIAHAATAKSGAACSRAGEKQTVSGYLYVCQTNLGKKRNEWVNKGKVPVSKPKVAPSATAKPKVVPSVTPRPSVSPVPSVTPVPSASPKPTPVPSVTPRPSVSPAPSLSPTPNGLLLAPVPMISGSSSPGNTLTVDPGVWDSGVSLSYQWFRSTIYGGPISGATDLSYVVKLADVGTSIWVRVIGSKTGFSPVEITSAPVLVTQTVKYIVLNPSPIISGVPASGNTLTANPGVWDSGVSLSYQWFRDGIAISGATGLSYVLAPIDQATSVSVTVTGAKPGFVTATRTTRLTILSNFTLNPVPVISNDPSLDNSLSVDPGVWDAGVSLNYQWFRNGVAISRATDSKYYLSASDVGANFSVRVVGSKTGFASSTQSSSSIVVGNLTLTPVPKIVGVAAVGNSLEVDSGVWEPGVALIYQWFRNGVALDRSSFGGRYLTTADYGASYRVTVMGIKAGFLSVTKSSASIVVASAPRRLTYTPVPVISGGISVGSTLTADPGVWDSGVSLSYQWLRNGVAISGANAPTYVLSQTDIPGNFWVKVTGAKEGSISVTQVSSALAAYSSLILTPVPIILGVPSPGNSLTVDPGVWDSGVSLSYQWLRNGVAISGATNVSYLLSRTNESETFSVRVTGRKSGYFSVAQSSENLLILSNLISSPAPFVMFFSQEKKLGAASLALWDSGVSLSYQWFRNGVAISGATEQFYTLSGSDVGANFSVSVTGVKKFFVTTTRFSETYTVPPF